MFDRTKHLVPKYEGHELMLSSFCCCELGCSYSPCNTILNQVDAKHKAIKYSDENIAIIKGGNSNKKSLSSTPFVKKLEYNNTHEGYWTYECIIL